MRPFRLICFATALAIVNGCSDKTADRLMDPPKPVKSDWPEFAELLSATKDLQPYLAVKKGATARQPKMPPEKKILAFRIAVARFTQIDIPARFEKKRELVEASRADATKLGSALANTSLGAAHVFESLREVLEKLRAE